MARVKMISPETADKETRKVYDAVREQWGRISNFSQVLAHQPAALQGWMLPNDAIRLKNVKADPDYADAIFNVALLLQRLERHAEAAARWKRYLKLDADSQWSARAKRALKFCEIKMTEMPASRSAPNKRCAVPGTPIMPAPSRMTSATGSMVVIPLTLSADLGWAQIKVPRFCGAKVLRM